MLFTYSNRYTKRNQCMVSLWRETSTGLIHSSPGKSTRQVPDVCRSPSYTGRMKAPGVWVLCYAWAGVWRRPAYRHLATPDVWRRLMYEGAMDVWTSYYEGALTTLRVDLHRTDRYYKVWFLLVYWKVGCPDLQKFPFCLGHIMAKNP